MATGPSQTQYEASPDPATRRALFDLKRQIAELQAIVADLEARIVVLETP